jgi:hypothetical protein
MERWDLKFLKNLGSSRQFQAGYRRYFLKGEKKGTITVELTGIVNQIFFFLFPFATATWAL